MALCDLPVDLLRLVTPFLSGVDIARLWFCGNSRLNRTLSCGGVQKFDLQGSGGLVSGLSRWWPPLVRQFPLLADFRLGWTSKSSLKLQELNFLSLPKALTRLQLISCPQASMFLSSDAIHLFTDLRDLDLSTSSRATVAQVKSLPSTLWKLVIGTQNVRDSLAFPAASLTDLTWFESVFSYETPDLSPFAKMKRLNIKLSNGRTPLPFPPELEGWTTHSPVYGTDLLLLPKSLLSIESYNMVWLQAETFNFLPRTLTSFLWYDPHLYLNKTLLRETEVSYLPRTLRHLVLPASITLERSSAFFLPPELLELICSFQNLPSIDVERALIHLNANSYQFNTIKGTLGRIPLPNKLRSFHTSSSAEPIMPIIPNTLEELLSADLAIVDGVCFNWPLSLKNISLSVQYASTQTEPLLGRLTPEDKQLWASVQQIRSTMETKGNQDDWFRLRLPSTLSSLSISLMDPMPLPWVIPHPTDPINGIKASSATPSTESKGDTDQMIQTGSGHSIHTALTRLSLSAFDLFSFETDLSDEEMSSEHNPQFLWRDMFPNGWSALLPSSLTYLYLDVPEFSVNVNWIVQLKAALRVLVIVRAIDLPPPVFYSQLSCSVTLEELDVQFKPSLDPWMDVDLTKYINLRRLTSYATTLPRLSQLPNRLQRLKLPLLSSGELGNFEQFGEPNTIHLCRSQAELCTIFP